jgi:hypothetical protein
MAYSLTTTGGVIRATDSAVIPPDPGNVDWQAYQDWLAAGNVAAPAVVPPAAVPSCALWQLQAVLTAAQWSQVTATVTALGNPSVSAFFAHGTNIIPASSTTLLALGAAIGMTSADVSALVERAAAVSIP